MNKATSSDTRNPLNSINKDYYFLNSRLGPVWTSKIWKKTENITDDGGKTFNLVQDRVLFGTYFFLDDLVNVHKLNRYNAFGFLSQIGGLLNTLTLVIGFFMVTYNSRATASSVI